MSVLGAYSPPSFSQKELIREVEMGLFKHSVDDGLDFRKAAFECMYTLLDSCLDLLDIRESLAHVESGLRDHHGIKMLTYLMVARRCCVSSRCCSGWTGWRSWPLKGSG